MQEPLRAGVVGAGVFGTFHARKYAAQPDVQLAAVYDAHGDRARALADELGSHAYIEFEPFIHACDVITIASPAQTHAELALPALDAGRQLYVEKPIAVSVEEARAMVTLARRSECVLAVGHQEREVFAAMGLFRTPERPIRLEAVRNGTLSQRCRDVSAVLDLMVHDIDLAVALDPSPVSGVSATGRTTVGPDTDEAEAEIRFEDGLTAVLRTSRVAEARERTMHLTYPSGEVWIDFVTHEFRNTTPFKLDPNFNDTPAGRDPLGASVKEFLAAVRGEAERPLVTGEEALRALQVTLDIDRAAAQS
jgi:predicted dehydrogenase